MSGLAAWPPAVRAPVVLVGPGREDTVRPDEAGRGRAYVLAGPPLVWLLLARACDRVCFAF